MKRVFLLFCLFLFGWLSASAQTKRPKLFRAIVRTETGVRIDGILYELTDSTLRYLRNTPETIGQLRAGQAIEVFEISGKQIKKVTIRRKQSLGRGAVFGVGSGMLAAAVPSYIDLSQGSTIVLPLLYTYVGIMIGGEIGMLVSILPRKQKRLDFNPTLFRDAKNELARFSYRYQQNENLTLR